MMLIPSMLKRHHHTLVALLVALLVGSTAAPGWSETLVDDQGRSILLDAPPRRVVSLVPSLTEIVFALGAGDTLVGVTYHDRWPAEANRLPVVGGFFSPSVAHVAALDPDAVLISSLQADVIDRFEDTDVRLICLEVDSLEDSFETIRQVGAILHRKDAAEALVTRIRSEMDLVAAKVARVPEGERLRVMRLMGRETPMAPGDDSFQNDMIRAAGGIPPVWGKDGAVVGISLDQWLEYNPQVLYGCGGDRQVAGAFFDKPGWRDVDAVKHGRIHWFPCDLTCRAASHTGYFVQWLAASIYTEAFGKPENLVLPEEVTGSRDLALDASCVRSARVLESRIHDFTNRTLLLELAEPMAVVSTLEGQRQGIGTVGNHYSPPPAWGIGHDKGLAGVRDHVHGVLGLTEKNASLLFTGADMDNLAVVRKDHRDLSVWALVTAGVLSNAVRMGEDTGMFYEPDFAHGTINTIILTNMRLTPRAMSRAIISATEAKSAALQDMDVRSTHLAPTCQATGTGTDNVLVVEGRGTLLDNAGGHSKLGELIARAVYEAVRDAVYKQNGMVAERHNFQRLRDRGITMYGITPKGPCDCNMDGGAMAAELEALLLDPEIAGFVTGAMALSDAAEAGLVADTAAFDIWAWEMAERVAGKPVDQKLDLVADDTLPPVLKTAMNALMTGIAARERRQEE